MVHRLTIDKTFHTHHFSPVWEYPEWAPGRPRWCPGWWSGGPCPWWSSPYPPAQSAPTHSDNSASNSAWPYSPQTCPRSSSRSRHPTASSGNTRSRVMRKQRFNRTLKSPIKRMRGYCKRFDVAVRSPLPLRSQADIGLQTGSWKYTRLWKHLRRRWACGCCWCSYGRTASSTFYSAPGNQTGPGSGITKQSGDELLQLFDQRVQIYIPRTLYTFTIISFLVITESYASGWIIV